MTVNADFLDEGNIATVSVWYYADGDHVNKGDTIGELMVEKAQLEIDAPCTGILTICKQLEDEVRKGDIVACIE